MKENYFDNPEETMMILKKMVANAQKKLEQAIANMEAKGDRALPPDEMNIYTAKLALQDAEKRLKSFEEELERRNIPAMGE